jgi:hypothetical protein
VEPGVTGYVVESVAEAICKVGSVLALDRGQVRRRFEERFTATRMTRDYLGIYASLIERRMPEARPRPGGRAAANGSTDRGERPAAAGLRDVVPVVAAGGSPTGS